MLPYGKPVPRDRPSPARYSVKPGFDLGFEVLKEQGNFAKLNVRDDWFRG